MLRMHHRRPHRERAHARNLPRANGGGNVQ
jgi:hypothetical protein